MKIYFIDGNNLMGKMPTLKSRMKTDKTGVREELAVKLDRVFIGTNNKVVLFLDGFQSDIIKTNKTSIVYSDSKTADTVIKSEIDRSKNPRNIVVVSSDHEVFNYGKKCSCEAMKSEDFILKFFRAVEEKEETERIQSLERQTDEFKKIFGIK